MKNWICGAAIPVALVAAAIRVQPLKGSELSSTDSMKSMTYRGCVVVANHGAVVLLKDIATDAVSMPNVHDMKSETMKPGQTSTGAAAMDSVPAKTMALSGLVDLQKHSGQTVSVTGMLSDAPPVWRDLPTLTVRSLKVIAKSCSQEEQR